MSMNISPHMDRNESPNDHWYTPPQLVEEVFTGAKACDAQFYDLMTSPGTPEIAGLEKVFDVDIYNDELMQTIMDRLWAIEGEGGPSPAIFCNPPFSKKSGGAQRHIRRLCKWNWAAYLFLVNYDVWVPRLAEELGLEVALIYPRVSFVPGHPSLKAGSPRYANAFLFSENIGLNLYDFGRYNIMTTGR